MVRACIAVSAVRASIINAKTAPPRCPSVMEVAPLPSSDTRRGDSSSTASQASLTHPSDVCRLAM
jgi:hypothetical protein